MSSPEELALSDLDRSNKGASKQRRDLINAEIAIMRELLPLTESARQRLSQLQVMSLSCVFIRKCNVLRQLFSSLPAETDLPSTCDFAQALTGFLLITTREGKLVYISENVTDYLGHSMVDMKTQGDSLFDIVDKRDEASVRAHLLQGGAAEPDLSRRVSFFCRMNMSRTLKRQSTFGDVKVMHVRGQFLPLSDPAGDPQRRKYVLMATCSPLVTPELKETLVQSNTMVFKTVHHMDMTFLEVTHTAEYHLGCSMEEICKKSWYSMLHPEDIHEARDKHLLLMRASQDMGCMLTVRMLTMRGDTLWVNVVMTVRQSAHASSDHAVIVCINQVISEEEAMQIRMQSHMFALYPPRTAQLWSNTNTTTTTTSPPHPLLPDPVCWIPPSSSSSSPSSVPSPFTVPSSQPVTGYVSGQLPPSSSTSHPTAALSPPGHTDKLKLMLKRKLQGPSPPAKVPKMTWDENARSVGSSSGGQGFEGGNHPSPFRGCGDVPGGCSWSGSTLVMSQAQLQAAKVFPVTVGQQVKVKVSPMALSPGQGSLSPPLPKVVAYQGMEQVVPQSAALPDSFLTPESSPASSPDPQTLSGSMKNAALPASSSTLRDLEKLPSFIQGQNIARLNAGLRIKTEQGVEEYRRPTSRRELPIMDAFDIESFFDTLDCDKHLLMMDKQQKNKLLQTPQEGRSASLDNVAASKTADLMGPSLRIKQETAAALITNPFPASPQQQVHGKPQEAKCPQQVVDDFRELEELLSFFSGDMTATQVNLDSLMTSPMAEPQARQQDFPKRQPEGEARICGAGHFDPFLLHGADLDRPQEGFSPVSEMSGDEESSNSGGEETLYNKLVKRDGGEKRGCVPPPSHPTPTPPSPPQAPQDVPGISEEDELYQLHKLLSMMASDNDVMVSPDWQ